MVMPFSAEPEPSSPVIGVTGVAGSSDSPTSDVVPEASPDAVPEDVPEDVPEEEPADTVAVSLLPDEELPLPELLLPEPPVE